MNRKAKCEQTEEKIDKAKRKILENYLAF